MIRSPWRMANSRMSVIRAIVPSSFMISQMTAAGVIPAITARSTDASVCPARFNTPPLFARSGKMWAGGVGRPRFRIDGAGDGLRAVGRGDAGGHASARLDRDGERGAVVRGVVLD